MKNAIRMFILSHSSFSLKYIRRIADVFKFFSANMPFFYFSFGFDFEYLHHPIAAIFYNTRSIKISDHGFHIISLRKNSDAI